MKRAAWIILVLLTGSGCRVFSPSVSEAALYWPDVIYEGTVYPVVQGMLDLAGVSSSDVVYDLGCGDGRIVIMAAKLRGARGVGVDIDPVRIRESRRNAESEGVADKVVFYEQNFFETEVAPATVVMLYLFQEVNLRLRPKLLRELKPGARIVSNTNTMGEWEPDSIRNVNGRNLYFFVVPANVTGLWSWDDQEGRPMSLSLSQNFQEVKGVLKAGSETTAIRSCALEGSTLSFVVERPVEGKVRLFFFRARVSGDRLEGAVVHEGGDTAGYPWKAARNPSTRLPIAK